MSQRTAIESMWLPGCSHQRCGLATAWARCAAVAIVVGAVVTQPVKPGMTDAQPAADDHVAQRLEDRLGAHALLGQRLVDERQPRRAGHEPGQAPRSG